MPSLEALTENRVAVTLSDGRTVHPRKLDAYGYQLSQSAKNEQESIEILLRLAARCTKGELSRDEVFGTDDVFGLTIEDASAIVRAASGQFEEVEASASPLSGVATGTATE